MKKKILLSLLASTILVAQDIELKPLQITSTAIQTDELKSTDAVEIYTSEDIQKAHVQNLYEFLNQQTSVIAMPSYGNPFSQKLDMRGYGIEDGYQNIIVTLDGRKINNIDMIAPLLGSISPSSIEKIEIIKSGGIVIGGDGANAGVINITTKKNNDKELSIYGGSYKTFDGAFYLGHSDDKLSLSASGEAQKSDGIRHINSGKERDEKKLSTAAFNVAYLPIDKLELRAGAASARVDVIYASYLTLDEYNEDVKQAGNSNWGATEQKFDTDAINAGVSYYANQKLSLHADARHEEKRSTYITYSSIADYDYDSAKLSVDFKDDFFSISFGVDMFEGKRDSHASSYAIASDTSKENLASFLMSNFNFGNHSIKAGARVEAVEYRYDDALNNLKDDYSLFGAELGYNYTLDKKSSVFLNYAHAYQAPDIDRFFNKDWLGNVSFNGFIDPMKTDSFTLGYNNITSKNKFKTSLFYVELKDEIYYYTDPSYISSKNTNIDKSHKYGFDVYDKFIISEIFNLALNYNYVKAKIDEEMQNGKNYAGKNLPGVSNHNAKTTLSYLPTSCIAFALTQSYRSKAYAANDFENNFAQKQDAYTSTDISAAYTKDTLELFAKINNLFNQKNGLWIEDNAIYPLDFTTTAIAGLKLKF